MVLQGLQAPSPVNQSPNDQIWRDEELARAMQVNCLSEFVLPGCLDVILHCRSYQSGHS